MSAGFEHTLIVRGEEDYETRLAKRRELEMAPWRLESLAKERQERFDNHVWLLRQALAWVAYRDPGRIDDDPPRGLLAIYKTVQATMPDPDRAQTLRGALVNGRLRTFRDQNEVPVAHWIGTALMARTMEWVFCRRDDVLALWPERKMPEVILSVPAPSGAADKGVNAQKRAAVLRAFRELEQLRGMSQKAREQAVIDYCKQSGVTVSDRYVRTLWKERS